MTLFSDNFQAASSLPTYFAETVIWYRAGTGAGESVPAIVQRTRRTREDDDTAEQYIEANTVRVAPTAVSGLAADAEGGLGDHVDVPTYLGSASFRRHVVKDRKDRGDGDLEFTLEALEEYQRISHAQRNRGE